MDVGFSNGVSGSFSTQVISNLLLVYYGSFVDGQSVVFPFVYLTSFCIVCEAKIMKFSSLRTEHLHILVLENPQLFMLFNTTSHLLHPLKVEFLLTKHRIAHSVPHALTTSP